MIKEREKFRTPTFEQMETGGILFTDEKSRFESKARKLLDWLWMKCLPYLEKL